LARHPFYLMSFFVYLLKSEKDQKLYIGMTSNVARRVKEHAAGKVPSTRHRCPCVLLYTESYPTRIEAAKRERFLKSGPGHRFLKTIIAEMVTSSLTRETPA